MIRYVKKIEMKQKLRLLCTIFIAMFFSFMPGAGAADLQSVILNNAYSCNGNYEESAWISDAICYSSAEYGVDPLLIASVMEAESSYDMGSYSSAGAIGYMQLMPETASMVGVNPYDPLENIIGGTSYLKSQLDSFANYGDMSVTYAVAAYNAGGGAVRMYGGVPPYSETIFYVNNVYNIYMKLLNQFNY